MRSEPLDPGHRLTGDRSALLARRGGRLSGRPKPLHGWWGEEDSNLRRHEPTDLQSAPFGRLGISPEPVGLHRLMADSAEGPRNGGAGGGNRTPDRLITNQLLYLLSYASRQTGNIHQTRNFNKQFSSSLHPTVREKHALLQSVSKYFLPLFELRPRRPFLAPMTLTNHFEQADRGGRGGIQRADLPQARDPHPPVTPALDERS